MSDPAGPLPAAEAGALRPWDGSDGVGARRTAGPGGRAAARRESRRAWTAAGRWGGAAEVRADLVPALRLAAVVVLAGIPAGLLWWLLAPREDYRVVADGVEPLGATSAELFAADDSVFVLVMAGLGLLAGLAGWALRRRRGVTVLAALAAGPGLAGVLAWQLGELLGAGPTREDLADVGATVTTRLELQSLPALAVAPFVAVLVYVVATLLASGEDLGRTPERAPAGPPASVDGPSGPGVS
ncbi:LPXTG cell wall anchor domain-containing protein [Blastococcus sp. SYSU D00695]